MTPAEAARILAVATTFDARLTPPSREDAAARALAWSEALAKNMTVDDAIRAVIRHYASQTTAIMPAHVNAAWRDRCRAEREEKERASITAVHVGVPMPPEIRAQLKAIGRQT